MKLIVSILACFLLISCTSSRNFPLVSTKVAAVPTHKIMGKVETESCGILNFKSMENKVLEQAKEMGGDAVIDFQVRLTSSTFVFYFIWIYMRDCYSITGTAVKFTGSGFDTPSVWDNVPQPATKEPESTWD